MTPAQPPACRSTGEAGFDRSLRLLAAADYSTVFSARRVLRGDRFDLHYRPSGLATPRLGLVVPKKQARAAVLRNAVKRMAREVFRHARAALPCHDLVLRLAKPVTGADAAARRAWRAEFAGLLDRLPGKSAERPATPVSRDAC